jgi:hypothetical protein
LFISKAPLSFSQPVLAVKRGTARRSVTLDRKRNVSEFFDFAERARDYRASMTMILTPLGFELAKGFAQGNA